MGVKCEICKREFEVITYTHLLSHNLSIKEYKEKYPYAEFHSEKHKQNYSKKISGKNHPYYGKTGKLAPFYNHKHTKQAKQKQSQGMTKKWKEKGFREEHSRKNHPNFGSGVFLGISGDWTNKNHTEKTKLKMSYSAIERFKNISDKDYKDWLNNVVSGIQRRPTSYEKRLEKILDNNWRYVGDGSLWLGFPPMNPDFIHRTFDLVIEVYAKYFKDDDYENQRRKRFNEIGYSVIFISDNELNEVIVNKKIGDYMSDNLGYSESSPEQGRDESNGSVIAPDLNGLVYHGLVAHLPTI